MEIKYAKLDNTPIDHLWVAAAECGLVAIQFRDTEEAFLALVKKLTKQLPEPDENALQPYFTELVEYLDGRRQKFDLPICWQFMTEFQRKSLRLVYAIPYGSIRTYKDIAADIGNLKSIRAVGRANATNPVPLVIPCHRVIGSDGNLTGFGGGIETKAQLLRMEGSWLL